MNGMVGYRRDSLFDNGTAWTEAGLRALGEKIVAWANGPTEYPTLTGYAIEHPGEISIGNVRKLKFKYDIFKEYCQEAERILAAKMVKRSFEGKASPYILKTYVPLYDREVKEHEDAREKYTSDLRKEEAEADTQTLADLAKAAADGELEQK